MLTESDFDDAVDDDGFILPHTRGRIEDLAIQSGNPRDFASHLAAQCGLAPGQFEVFLQGDLSVPPERAHRIEAALDAVADRDCGSDLGGFNASGGDGGLAALFADLDEMIADPVEPEAVEPARFENDRDESGHACELEPVEDQAEEEAAASEPESATVELDPIEPVDPILEDAVERYQQRSNRTLLALIGSVPVELTEPVESVAIDEVERFALVAEPEPAEFEPRPPRSRTKAKPNKSTGSHDLSRDKRAASAVAGIVTRPKPRSMSSTRGQLATLRQEARRRLTALQNATKTRSDHMLRQLAGREAEVVAWWLAYAYARVLYGPDATQQQIAETKVDLDAAADPDAPKAKPNRRQAQTAIERTHRLEARGMPWQRYVTHGVREFREIFGRSAASELAPPLHRPDPVRS